MAFTEILRRHITALAYMEPPPEIVVIAPLKDSSRKRARVTVAVITVLVAILIAYMAVRFISVVAPRQGFSSSAYPDPTDSEQSFPHRPTFDSATQHPAMLIPDRRYWCQ